MSEELNLVKDLAVILIAAGFFTIVFKALKQPLILGYIMAGFVVGPHLGLFSLTSHEAVNQWSEPCSRKSLITALSVSSFMTVSPQSWQV